MTGFFRLTVEHREMKDKDNVSCKKCSRAWIFSTLAMVIAISSVFFTVYINIQMNELKSQVEMLQHEKTWKNQPKFKSGDMEKLITSLPTLRRMKRNLRIKQQQMATMQNIMKNLEAMKLSSEKGDAMKNCHRTLSSGGKQGKRGKAGPRGPKGDRGVAGPVGMPGRLGQKGQKGDRGLRGPPGLSIKKAQIRTKPTDVVALKGSVATFTCNAIGYPEPEIAWIVNKKRVEVSTKRYKLIKNDGLEITDVEENDHGKVTCIAKNIIGEDRAQASLSVLVVPVVRTSPKQIVAKRGGQFVVTCNATGFPKPKLQWKRFRSILPASAVAKSDGRLVFKNINRDDAGYYICIAENSAGKAETSTIIIVQDWKSRDCKDLFEQGKTKNGVYTITNEENESFQVYCDMTNHGGGWTVFQRRTEKSTDFFRGWNDYKRGFGDLNGDFWLGLDKISKLTIKPSSLLVELHDISGIKGYAKYSTFKVGNEQTNYKLEIQGYSGNASDSLMYHRDMPFSTKDNDNDELSHGNCAVSFKGAWWYRKCHYSNLNALHPNSRGGATVKMSWYFWKNAHGRVKASEMKLRKLR